MKILFFGIILVLMALFLHFVLWKIRVPRNPVVALLIIFMSVLCMGLISAHFLNERCSVFPYGFWEFLHAIIFYIPVMLVYIITYVGLEDDSPSMAIVAFVAWAKEKGRRRDEFNQIITNEALILPRTQVMIKDGWIIHNGQGYRLTSRGHFYNKIFSIWRRLLNISEGG